MKKWFNIGLSLLIGLIFAILAIAIYAVVCIVAFLLKWILIAIVGTVVIAGIIFVFLSTKWKK